MEAFLVSTLAVAVAEIGDKTQLLACVLAARFRRPGPIVLGILFATLANHALAGLAGRWAGDQLDGAWLRRAVGLSFLAVAAWTLIPDKLDSSQTPAPGRWGPFATTLVAFFLVEIGDKTQVATVALAARFDALAPVVLGTTVGMMLANVPAVALARFAADRLPLRAIRLAAAALFAALGVAALVGPGL